MKLKKGISLIVLVITIIIMIILATAIIISLTNNNIIDKANTAINETNLKTIEEAANVALGEVLLEQNDTMTDSEYTTAIENKMKASGISDTELAKYNITYTGGKVSVSKPGSGSSTTLTSIAVGDEWTNVSLNLPLEKITLAEDTEINILENDTGNVWEFEYYVIEDLEANKHPIIYIYYEFEDDGYSYGYYSWETFSYDDKGETDTYEAGWNEEEEELTPVDIEDIVINGTVLEDEDFDTTLASQLASWFKAN